MATGKKVDLGNTLALRKQEGVNQQTYWSRYGITQSGGSRYESGRAIPKPAKMLVWLHQSGRISDDDLKDALKAASPKKK